MPQYDLVFSFTLSLYPLLRGMLSQISVGGYEKLLLTNSVRSALLGRIQVEDSAAHVIGWSTALVLSGLINCE